MTPITSGLSPSMFDPSAAQGLNSQSGSEQIESVGVEFESVFLSMMLKEMRNSLEGGLFSGEGSDSYGGMFHMFIGKHMAETSPLGIGEMLVQQYSNSKPSVGSAGGAGSSISVTT